MVQTAVRSSQLAQLLSYPLACMILTPDGTMVARGRALPRHAEHLEEAYSLELAEVEPRGVLEGLMYADRPHLILQVDGAGEIAVRLDHITGPAQRREYYCHLR